MTDSVATKFNFKVEEQDAIEFRKRAHALGWSTSALARKLVEEFNAGHIRLSLSARDRKLMQEIYK